MSELSLGVKIETTNKATAVKKSRLCGSSLILNMVELIAANGPKLCAGVELELCPPGTAVD